MIWLLIPLAIIALVFLFQRWLRGPSLTRLDIPQPDITYDFDTPPDGHMDVLKALRETPRPDPSLPRREQLEISRYNIERFGRDREFDATFTSVEGEIQGEWVLAEGADPARRLLYIHGGAFMLGSPVSHRMITSEFSKRTGAAVFAMRYRLMPEHPRRACIEDTRAAYRWLLENGPDGPATATATAIAGDSAGGNLTLSLAAWLRTQDLLQPSALVTIAPITDHNISAPSIRGNFETDYMLKPFFAPLRKVPQFFNPILASMMHRHRACNPEISPVFHDLSGMPPILIQNSAAEMLHGDNVRFYNKAKDAGVDVTLQSWSHLVHVFHFFDHMLPETDRAWNNIEAFLSERF